MDYLDFEIEISEGIGREFPVSVYRSPAGQARETMQFPFDEIELSLHQKDLEIALLRSGGDVRRVLSSQEESVQTFGHRLFQALITGEIRGRYDASMALATQQEKGLRIALRILPASMNSLPWELMYDVRNGTYLALSIRTPFVRSPEVPASLAPLRVVPPLRVLVMTANPKNLAVLAIDRERERIRSALDKLRGAIETTWLAGHGWRDLQRAFRSEKRGYHVFHFIGHGSFNNLTREGQIAFEDEDGKAELQSATILAGILGAYPQLRLVFLNSCEGARSDDQDIFSSSASMLVRSGIPAVLAMQHNITDAAAVEFARNFYESLADNLPIDVAVAEARTAVRAAVTNTVEWSTPVLYMKTPDGRLFDFEPSTQISPKTTSAVVNTVPPQSDRDVPPSPKKNTEEESKKKKRRYLVIFTSIFASILIIVFMDILLQFKHPRLPITLLEPPTGVALAKDVTKVSLRWDSVQLAQKYLVQVNSGSAIRTFETKLPQYIYDATQDKKQDSWQIIAYGDKDVILAQSPIWIFATQDPQNADSPPVNVITNKIDNSAPNIKGSLIARGVPFSPGLDGNLNDFRLEMRIEQPTPEDYWELEIFDPKGFSFYKHSVKGLSDSPSNIYWDGRSNDGELVQSAENYTAVLRTRNALNQWSTIKCQIATDIVVVKRGDLIDFSVPSFEFEPNTADLLKGGIENVAKNAWILTQIAGILKKYDKYNVQIFGNGVLINYMDSRKKELENNAELIPLSKARAEAVRERLINLGINANRMTAEGLGGTTPVVMYSDLVNRWKNRRIDFELSP